MPIISSAQLLGCQKSNIINIELFSRSRPLPATTVTNKSSPLRPVHSNFFGNGEPIFIPLFVRHPWWLEVLFQFFAYDASPVGFYTTGWSLPHHRCSCNSGLLGLCGTSFLGLDCRLVGSSSPDVKCSTKLSSLRRG